MKSCSSYAERLRLRLLGWRQRFWLHKLLCWRQRWRPRHRSAQCLYAATNAVKVLEAKAEMKAATKASFKAELHVRMQ